MSDVTEMTPLGELAVVPAPERLDLVAPPVAESLRGWSEAGRVGLVEIDPAYADTAAMAERYRVPMDAGANCVIVTGRRDGQERIAACVVRADTRADVNGLVKRTLDVRKCSFLAHERAVAESSMEYGGITPVGLPASWRILVDAQVLEIDRAIIGSGIRGSKLLMPGGLFATLPGAEIVEGLAG